MRQEFIELDPFSYKMLQDLRKKIEGNDLFIIGGGPSLKGFDFNKLKGKFTIGINKAYESIIPTILYYSDKCFYDWYGPKIDSLQCKKATISDVKKPDTIKLGCTGTDGLEMRFGNIRHGQNSGYAALNLAFHLRPKHIFLLGFDMQQTDNQEHWHSGYSDKRKVTGPLFSANKWVESFKTIATPLAQTGVKVFNCNPDSGLLCFPFCDIKTVLK